MKGYWHYTAFSVVISALTVMLNQYYFIIFFFLWLFYLFYTERLRKLPLVVSLIFFMFFIIYIPPKHISKTSDMPLGQQGDIIGMITSPLSIKPNKLEFTLKDKQTDKKVLILFFPSDNYDELNLDDFNHLKYGAQCSVTGLLELPAVSRNPGQFDYQAFLAHKGITYQMIVSSLEDVNCHGQSLLNTIYANRLNMINYVNHSVSEETAAWMNALVLGDDSYLNEDIVELFQRWGLSHLLAISGLHVGLIVALIYFIMVKFTIVTKETAQWLMMIFLPVYAFLAGGEPSVWRASMMVFLVIIFNKANLKHSATDTLSIVFIFLILINKYVVYHIGFQLSFIVTLGLILSRQLISDTHSRFFQLLYISFVSQFMILPLQLTYFSTFQPLSIVLNLIVVPYFSFFVIPLMFLMILFSPFLSRMITMTDGIFVYVHDFFLLGIEWLDRFAYYPLVIGEIPLFVSVIYYGLFFLFMKKLETKQLISAFKYGCSIVLLMICLVIRPYLSPYGTVTMLDIGQGDAIVIELPYRKGVFLIDAGSGFSFDDHEPTKHVYQRIIKPYLYLKGIIKIDAIFLSHEHVDHMGSVSYLLEDFNVEEIIISNYYKLNAHFEAEWDKHDVLIRRVEKDQKIYLNDHYFYVVSPAQDVDANENSLVLYTELGGMYWLFTGDIYQSTERELTTNYNHLIVDVLKVAHHGSDTSTDETFIEQVNPSYALIPVGLNNRYGHPAPDVIKRLEERLITILRTDQDGAIQFRFKNQDIGTFFKHLP